MKKVLFTMMIGMTAGLVMAQDTVMVEKQQADLAVTGESGFYSAYVWRGLILNDGPVSQPSLTVEKGAFSLNIWANYNIDGKDGGPDKDVNETDFTLSYTIPDSSDNFDINVGAIHYAYSDPRFDDIDTTELFVSSTFYNIILTPVVSLYYDADQVEGWYGSLALSQGFEISDALTAEVGGSVGMGEGGYNDYYFGSGAGGAGMNDYNVYVSGSYAVTEDLSLGAKLAYTMLDGAVADEGKDYYGADNTLWGGVSLSYQF
jgi:hypothetical protein